MPYGLWLRVATHRFRRQGLNHPHGCYLQICCTFMYSHLLMMHHHMSLQNASIHEGQIPDHEKAMRLMLLKPHLAC